MLHVDDIELDRDHNTITMTRRIAAAPERVFEAWTQPDQVSQWWDPEGKPLAECRIDLRTGGSLYFVPAASGHAFQGTWRLIDPPHRLSFDAMGAKGDLSFERDGAQTRMTLVMTCASSEHFEQFIKMGIDRGTSATLANLARYLTT